MPVKSKLQKRSKNGRPLLQKRSRPARSRALRVRRKVLPKTRGTSHPTGMYTCITTHIHLYVGIVQGFMHVMLAGRQQESMWIQFPDFWPGEQLKTARRKFLSTSSVHFLAVNVFAIDKSHVCLAKLRLISNSSDLLQSKLSQFAAWQ